jgi:cell division protein FtsB
MDQLKAEYQALSDERSKTNREIEKINTKIDLKQKQVGAPSSRVH